MKNRKQGFTLVEIMIVVMIIGLLAAIAVPGFQRAREASQRNACINNLRMIEDAKDQYAIEEGIATDSVVAEADIQPYLRQEEVPVCPVGDAAYALGNIGDVPTCTNDNLGHVFGGGDAPAGQ